MPDSITLRHDWRGEDRALIADLHRQGYLGYDQRFTATHVEALADIVCGMIDEAGIGRDPEHRVWFAERPRPDGTMDTLGCVGLVRRGERGQLRWLVVLPEARGLGLGRRLVSELIDYARALDLREIYLLTAPGLTESMALYQAHGFETKEERVAALWHGDDTEIEMARPL